MRIWGDSINYLAGIWTVLDSIDIQYTFLSVLACCHFKSIYGSIFASPEASGRKLKTHKNDQMRSVKKLPNLMSKHISTTLALGVRTELFAGARHFK